MTCPSHRVTSRRVIVVGVVVVVVMVVVAARAGVGTIFVFCSFFFFFCFGRWRVLRSDMCRISIEDYRPFLPR